VAIVATTDGARYRLLGADGEVYPFGNAKRASIHSARHPGRATLFLDPKVWTQEGGSA
jgi:hypothetical protein